MHSPVVSMRLGVALALCASLSTGSTACSADESEGYEADGASPDDVPKATCSARCERRTGNCNFSEAQGKQLCDTLCKNGLTDAALACMDEQPCSANEHTLEGCSDAPAGDARK